MHEEILYYPKVMSPQQELLSNSKIIHKDHICTRIQDYNN